MVHPDISNPALLYAMRDEAIVLSKSIENLHLRLTYELFGCACGQLAAMIENTDLSMRLQEQIQEVGKLNTIISQLQIELTKYIG